MQHLVHYSSVPTYDKYFIITSQTAYHMYDCFKFIHNPNYTYSYMHGRSVMVTPTQFLSYCYIYAGGMTHSRHALVIPPESQGMIPPLCSLYYY